MDSGMIIWSKLILSHPPKYSEPLRREHQTGWWQFSSTGGEGREFGFSATWLFSAVSPPHGSWAFSGGPFSRRPAETLPSPPPFMDL